MHVSAIFGVWFGDSWMNKPDGTVFYTEHRGVAEAMRRNAISRGGDPDMSVAAIDESGRPVGLGAQIGPREHKAPPPITPDPSTMGRR
jgi:hypothetical protein